MHCSPLIVKGFYNMFGKFSWLEIIWKGTHTCLYQVPSLAVQRTHQVQGHNCRPECIKAQVWGRVQKISAHLKSHSAQWSPSFISGKHFEPPGLLSWLPDRLMHRQSSLTIKEHSLLTTGKSSMLYSCIVIWVQGSRERGNPHTSAAFGT